MSVYFIFSFLVCLFNALPVSNIKLDGTLKMQYPFICDISVSYAASTFVCYCNVSFRGRTL
jgi:hypothetical protein